MGLKPTGVGSADDEAAPEIVAEINITPLTDVFLVLLIIFMVTTSVMSQMGVDVDLPQASQTTANAQPEGVVVTLLKAGGLKVNGGRVIAASDELLLKSKVKEALRDSKQKLVILEGDRGAYLGSAIRVMDLAREAGALRFAIAAELKGK